MYDTYRTRVLIDNNLYDTYRKRVLIDFTFQQLEVLSHPSIACFVSHCGWNSVQESITMGVAMICSPYFTDQFLNRTYIVDVWKIGLPLETNKDGVIEKGEITKAVDRMLVREDGAEIRKQVTKLMRNSSDTVKEGGSSFNNYSILLHQMKKHLAD
ncbi:flavonol 3-O-glucosyltransferase F3GT2-like [Cryptomeria japonica]|uniref:flavonol 3-O-glucosyltransferase F3GT2-like n=1 Tax=Cryptomeria japonica TaxID=3369 RepID=UPI0025AB7F0F|nr:flavonol 3-O-glucosyltransferase F3GT2-like [Cryptomeria japonica]